MERSARRDVHPGCDKSRGVRLPAAPLSGLDHPTPQTLLLDGDQFLRLVPYLRKETSVKAETTFLNNLAQSVPVTFRVAAWLQRDQGMDVRVLPVAVRPDAAQRLEFGDDGDIELILRVEVKKRGLHFTGRGDYPYPTVIVDEAYKVDRAGRRFWAYYIVNETETAVCMVPAASRKFWELRPRFDSKEGEQRMFYECPVEHCRFFEMV